MTETWREARTMGPVRGAAALRAGGRLRAGCQAPEIAAKAVSGAAVRVPGPALTHVQFLRFAGCPVCNLGLQEYIKRVAELSAAGVREVIFFHSEARFIEAYHAALPFEVIADPQRQFYRAFGVETSARALLNPLAWPAVLRGYALRGAGAQDSTRLGLPADFLISPQRHILACHYGAHAADQWRVDDVLRLARTLNPKTITDMQL